MKANRECGLDVSRRPSHSDGRFIQPIRIGFGQYHRPFRRIMGRFSQEHHFGVQGEQMVRCLAKPDPGLARSDGHIKLRIGNAFVKFHQINNLIIAVTMRLCLLYRGGTPAGGTNEYLAFVHRLKYPRVGAGLQFDRQPNVCLDNRLDDLGGDGDRRQFGTPTTRSAARAGLAIARVVAMAVMSLVCSYRGFPSAAKNFIALESSRWAG
jgi:hypothetical protein